MGKQKLSTHGKLAIVKTVSEIKIQKVESKITIREDTEPVVKAHKPDRPENYLKWRPKAAWKAIC